MRILSGEKSTCERNVLEAARLVDQTMGTGSSSGGYVRPMGGAGIKGIQSMLMGQQQGDRLSASSKRPRSNTSQNQVPQVPYGQTKVVSEKFTSTLCTTRTSLNYIIFI